MLAPTIPQKLLFFIIGTMCVIASPDAAAQQGELDRSFGVEGKVVAPFAGIASCAAVQPDGRIAVGGWAYGPDGLDQDILLTRFLPDGTLDTSFGSDGITRTHILGGDEATELVVPGDGSILLVGLTNLPDMPTPESRHLIALARYTRDGSLDPAFGTNGSVIIDATSDQEGGSGHRVTDMAVDSSGLIYVAGSLHGHPDPVQEDLDSLLLARLLPDGTLDPSFGDGGIVKTGLAPDSYDMTLHILLVPDGVVAAASSRQGDRRNLTVLRYNLDGSLEEGFGAGGVTFLPGEAASFNPVGLALMPDGAFAVAGGLETSAWTGVAVARFNAEGRLDLTFADDGIASLPLSNRTVEGVQLGAVLTTDAVFLNGGTVLIGGSVDEASRDFFIVQINEDGTVEESFGDEGVVVTQVNGADLLVSLITQPDGKAIAVGHDISLARYLLAPGTATEPSPRDLGHRVRLEAPYPNPVQGEATVRFRLDRAAQVRLVVYDLLGREVFIVTEGRRAPGTHSVIVGTDGIPAGHYLLRLEAGSELKTRSLVVGGQRER